MNKLRETEITRVICGSEDCNRSFYTFHPQEVTRCPYCGEVEELIHASDKLMYTLYVEAKGE